MSTLQIAEQKEALIHELNQAVRHGDYEEAHYVARQLKRTFNTDSDLISHYAGPNTGWADPIRQRC